MGKFLGKFFAPAYLAALVAVFAVVTAYSVPKDWQTKVDSFNGYFAENDDGEINAETGFPKGLYLPLIGNGYISHAKGVRGDAMFVSGVFNGETTSPSHRARIPAQYAVQIDQSTTTGCLLDIENAVYHRRGVLSDKSSTYELRWYAHRELRSLYVLEFKALSIAGEVNVSMTNNHGDPSEDFKFQDPVAFGDFASTICGQTTIPETTGGPTPVVCVSTSTIPSAATPLLLKPADSGKTFTFISSFRSSLDTASSDVGKVAKASQADYFEGVTRAYSGTLAQTHSDAWAKLWTSGIEVGGRSDVAIAVNASLYAILSSVRDDWPYGLAPGGLTNYYNGHSFWDTETWMYPCLLMLHPTISQSLLLYRFNRLDGARQKALSYDPPFAGTMFPWESAFSGVETCPTFAATGLREDHISGDIAFAIWQEYLMRRDDAWLKEIGYPMLKGIADFWVSRTTLTTGTDGKVVAHINDIIPPDEYVDHVNDSVYSNFVAAQSLRFAVLAANILGVEDDANSKYSALAEQIVILFNETLGVHPEYEGYPGDLIKQADVVLLHYPLQMEMTTETMKADLDYYSERTDAVNGPAMTWGMHAISYIDLLEMDKAAKYFNSSFQDNMHAPFNVWTEVPYGGAVNFVTGAGGFLQSLVMGYPGVRLEPSGDIAVTPRCPEGVTSMKIRGLQYLGNELGIEYSCANGGFLPEEVTFDTLSAKTDAEQLFLKSKSIQSDAFPRLGVFKRKIATIGERFVISANK